MPQPPDQPKPRPATDPHTRQLERVERLAEFGAQMAATLRAEFIYYWDRADRRTEVPEAAGFVTRVDALRNLTARYLREAARCRNLPPVQAVHVLRMLDLNELLEAGRGLEATGRVLRERAKERGWGTGRLAESGRGGLPWTDPEGWTRLFQGLPVAKAPAEEKPRGGWLTGRLQAMVERVGIVPAEKREGPPPPPPPGTRRLQAFEGALGLVSDLVVEAEPRIAALRVAIAGGDLPTRGPAGEGYAVRVPPELRPLVAPAAAVIASDPAHRRLAIIAVNQWDQARRMLEDFEHARDAARKVPPEQVGEVLRPYQIDKLKGAIMPLTNLHVTFRAAPALAVLFPPPVARKLEANLPPKEIERPAPEPEEGEVAEAPEPEPPPPPKFNAEETSRRRMGLIMAYLTEPESVPELSDETMVYRLVAEEHAYQDDRVIDLGMRVRLLPEGHTEEERTALAAQRATLLMALDEARQNRAHLQELLGMVAGSRE